MNPELRRLHNNPSGVDTGGDTQVSLQGRWMQSWSPQLLGRGQQVGLSSWPSAGSPQSRTLSPEVTHPARSSGHHPKHLFSELTIGSATTFVETI